MTATIPRISKRPRNEDDMYPTSDGKPMAETDIHLNQMFYMINGLAAHYADDPNVYVAGNNFLYYEQGNPHAVVSPDCYVVFDVPKHERNTFMVWKENGRTPNVAFEITSKKTRRQDTDRKRPMYERILRVPEYFMFDPTGDYLRPRLQGYRLVEDRYEAIPLTENRMRSEQLGLDLLLEGSTLRLYDPIRDIVLLTPLEAMQRVEREARRADLEAYKAEQQAQRAIDAIQRAEQEAQRAEQEAQRAEQEAQRADNADAENARLRAELAALRGGS